MKKFSAPPMIIILDVLFVVLFVLVMEQSPSIQIVLPKDIWLEDTVILSEDKNKKIKHWFNMKTQLWESFKTFPVNKFNFAIGRIACENNKFCVTIPSVYNETKKIYIIGKLYAQISGLISDSCLAFPKQCSNVTYHIKDDGRVNKKLLRDEYRFFRFILRDSKKQ